MEQPGGANAAAVGSRYDALLQQIVQLNTDLQKTAALSQTLQRERDGLQQNNSKLNEEAKRTHERCEKLQLLLMQATEQKIEADRKHEELIATWKRQLEIKAKAFESLQKKFAPPKDLEQLRFKIQEELELPHQQKVETLQDEIEKHRQIAFTMRREYEMLKTAFDQFSMDQGNEMECIHATYEMKMKDLKKRLAHEEERARDAQNNDIIRRLEQQKDAMQVEIKLLHVEIQDAQVEIKRVMDSAHRDKSDRDRRLTDEIARNANIELDLKALTRQLAKSKEEIESFRSKWDDAQARILVLETENHTLHDQLKQKEQTVLDSHQTLSSKLRDERSVYERDQANLKDRINELTLQLNSAENVVQKLTAASVQRKDSDSSADHSLLLKSREQDVQKYQTLAAAMEKKAAASEEELRRCQIEAEDSIHKLQVENENVRRVVQNLEMEKEHLAAKQTSTQELLTKAKAESITLRTKLKDMESELRSLEAKHRDSAQYRDDLQLENEQMSSKLKFIEQDCAALAEKLEKEKDAHTATTRDLQRKCSMLEEGFFTERRALKQEMKRALTKALQELSKSQKKREAYKRKCVEAHERYKQLIEETNFHESKLIQMKQDHSNELQQLLAQLSQLESDKTMLMQRQMDLSPLSPRD